MTDLKIAAYRIRIMLDDSPEEPELYTAFARIERGSVTGLCSGLYSERAEISREAALVAAIEHWDTDPSESRWMLVEHYMRVFWDVPELFCEYSDGIRGWYVATFRGDLDQYTAWARGEVFGYVVERQRHIRHVRVNLDTGDEAVTDCDEWETVDSCWGYYSTKDAIAAGRESLPSYTSAEVDCEF